MAALSCTVAEELNLDQLGATRPSCSAQLMHWTRVLAIYMDEGPGYLHGRGSWLFTWMRELVIYTGKCPGYLQISVFTLYAGIYTPIESC